MSVGVDTEHSVALGAICALVGASLWGFSGACAQLLYGNTAITPEFVTAARAFLTAIAFAVAALVRFRDRFLGLLRDRRGRSALILYAFGLFASQVGYAFAIKATNAGTATVLQSLFMVIVVVATCIRSHRAPHLAEAVGLVFAMVGTWLIATGGDFGALVLPLDGLAWGLVAAIAVAVYIMVPKKLYERWSSFPVIAAGMILNSIMAIALWCVTSAVDGGFSIPVFTVQEFVVLVFGVALVGTAISYGLYLYGVSVVGSVRGSLLGAVEPVSAMILAVVWLGTPLVAADWLGAGLMVVMIILVSLSKK